MNKTNIEWTDYTWNPLTGCTRGCDYCYARKLAKGRLKDDFTPNVHEDRFESGIRKLKSDKMKGAKVFVGSMGDVFDKAFDTPTIDLVIQVARDFPDTTFQFLTKCSSRLKEFEFPQNAWVGVTVEDPVAYRHRLIEIKAVNAAIKFVSIEPIMARFEPADLAGLDWVIIGCQTGAGAPSRFLRTQDILRTAQAADKFGIPLFFKMNTGLAGPKNFPRMKGA